ncbi:MAG TPA: hypothetical protein VF384_00065 [Planctomycetota bacterium]
MKTFLSIVLATALCAPAFAQKGGMSASAPTIKQSIMAGAAKISLDYTAIPWVRGENMAKILDKANGADARKGLNNRAPKDPLASFSTSVDVTCGDLQIPAGDYQVFFTITEELVWNINFQGKDKLLTTKLNVSNDDKHESKRLLLCLYAGEESGAGVYVAFGKQSGMINFTPGAAKAADAKAGK